MSSLIKCKFCEIWDFPYSISGHYKRKHPEEKIKPDWFITNKENMPDVAPSLALQNFIAKEILRQASRKKQLPITTSTNLSSTLKVTKVKHKGKNTTPKKCPKKMPLSQDNNITHSNQSQIDHQKIDRTSKYNKDLFYSELFRARAVSQQPIVKNNTKSFESGNTSLPKSVSFSNEIVPMPCQDLGLGHLALSEGKIEKKCTPDGNFIYTQITACRCGGSNSNCCHCDGTGYYNREIFHQGTKESMVDKIRASTKKISRTESNFSKDARGGETYAIREFGRYGSNPLHDDYDN